MTDTTMVAGSTLIPVTATPTCRLAQESDGYAEYYLGDALGSVRQLVEEDGVVTYATSYAPYGEGSMMRYLPISLLVGSIINGKSIMTDYYNL